VIPNLAKDTVSSMLLCENTSASYGKITSVTTTAFLLLTLKNDGTSPVWIKHLRARLVMVDSVDKLPKKPDLNDADNQNWYPPPFSEQESVRLRLTGNGSQVAKEKCVVYGKITYLDIFRQERFSTFGYFIQSGGSAASEVTGQAPSLDLAKTESLVDGHFFASRSYKRCSRAWLNSSPRWKNHTPMLKSTQMISLNLYQLKQVGSDYILLTNDTTDVRITFADRPADAQDDLVPTKEEEAAFFRAVQCKIGLETPIVAPQRPTNIDIFLDHRVESFGLLRSVPFPFYVARIEVG
jgi:hypothetical protein